MDERDVRAVVAVRGEEIIALVPEAEIYLTGSASVPGLSARDIDLVAPVADVSVATVVIRKIYPTLYEEQWSEEWAAFRLEGPPQVDLVLTKPGTKWDAHHRLAWNLLREDSSLLAEYAALKRDEGQKVVFFERIVRLLRPAPPCDDRYGQVAAQRRDGAICDVDASHLRRPPGGEHGHGLEAVRAKEHWRMRLTLAPGGTGML